MKKGFEDSFEDFRGHSYPGIFHRQKDVFAGCSPGAMFAESRIELGYICRNLQLTAIGHRVAGVNG